MFLTLSLNYLILMLNKTIKTICMTPITCFIEQNASTHSVTYLDGY